jgi:hypothetical protein
MIPAKRRSVYQGGKVVPEPTGHEHKKLSPRYPAFGGRASPTSGRHSNASVTHRFL